MLLRASSNPLGAAAPPALSSYPIIPQGGALRPLPALPTARPHWTHRCLAEKSGNGVGTQQTTRMELNEVAGIRWGSAGADATTCASRPGSAWPLARPAPAPPRARPVPPPGPRGCCWGLLQLEIPCTRDASWQPFCLKLQSELGSLGRYSTSAPVPSFSLRGTAHLLGAESVKKEERPCKSSGENCRLVWS